MKFLFVFTMLSFLAVDLVILDENCPDAKEPTCQEETEYNTYITCIQAHRKQKRSVACPLQQQQLEPVNCEYVDCQQCQNTCVPNCPECGTCSHACRQCCSETCDTNLCCHRTCHNQCRTNYCRAECKRECKERVIKIIGDGESGEHSSQASNSSFQARHNITTIINLQNIINNTNLIDIPIRINNTNYNNITLRRDEFDRSQQQQRCCHVIGPRQCARTNSFPFMRCFRYRQWQCNSQCTSHTMHTLQHRQCDRSGCGNKFAYVPEPQPRCHYQKQWPYVNCGGGYGTARHCLGCYDHYIDRKDGVNFDPRCAKCYDNGYGLGPYYRQGPFYQPNYYHTPNCWELGNCGFGAFEGGGGYFPFGGSPFPFQGYQQFSEYPPFGGMEGYPYWDPMSPTYFEPNITEPEITLNVTANPIQKTGHALISIDTEKNKLKRYKRIGKQ